MSIRDKNIYWWAAAATIGVGALTLLLFLGVTPSGDSKGTDDGPLQGSTTSLRVSTPPTSGAVRITTTTQGSTSSRPASTSSTVAEEAAPSGLRLASLEWVQETGDCSTTERTGAAQIGSSSYADSIYFECRPSRFKILEFDVAGAYQQFETYIGIRSDSPTNSTALFELLDEHDNSLTAPVEIGFGDAEAVTANIAGVLRLKLKISMLTGDNDSAIVWGTPTAVSP